MTAEPLGVSERFDHHRRCGPRLWKPFRRADKIHAGFAMKNSSVEIDRPTVVAGGVAALTAEQHRAVSKLAALVRRLDDEQACALIELIDEFQRDDYLARLRPDDLPTVKILAEVINGWDPDGVYEFARAWTSTLVARDDGFCWDSCTPRQKTEHHRRVLAEMARRGLPA